MRKSFTVFFEKKSSKYYEAQQFADYQSDDQVGRTSSGATDLSLIAILVQPLILKVVVTV